MEKDTFGIISNLKKCSFFLLLIHRLVTKDRHDRFELLKPVRVILLQQDFTYILYTISFW